jgi:FtsH-binding integral membrane protein
MKKNILIGDAITICGLLISLGPQFLFKACGVHGDSPPLCFYSVRAELGVGLIIAALGVCLLIFSDIKIQQGLNIGLFFIGIIALFITIWLIGGCSSETMRCHKVAFPPLIVISAVVTAVAVFNMLLINRKVKI